MPNPFLTRGGLDRQLGFALREASMAVWNDLRRTLDPLGLKPQSYASLLIIDTSPGCKQQDIADALGIQRPNLVALIDGLVEQDLVRRRVNNDDRRSYTLTLSTAGAVLLARARAAHVAHEARLAAALPPRASKALLARLARLAAL